LIRKKPIVAAVVPLVLILALTGFVSVAPVEAVDSSALFGSQWFDWSDHRMKLAARVFFARFSGGSLDINDRHFELRKDHGFTDDPEPFRELFGELYIDRLGLRFYLGEDSTCHGRVTSGIIGARISELETATGSMGIDLDIVRYPFLRLGINGDMQFGEMKFQDRREEIAGNWRQYNFGSGFTAGAHIKAIPGRIRGVPLTLDARVQIPIPVRIGNKECKTTDLEISGGVRPAIWNMSSFGLSTMSIGLSGGYRYVNVEAQTLRELTDVTFKAKWQGAFLELSFNY
jgi:hypothetical protein